MDLLFFDIRNLKTGRCLPTKAMSIYYTSAHQIITYTYIVMLNIHLFQNMILILKTIHLATLADNRRPYIVL